MPKVSVVMPVYNACDYLEMSLNSILSQTISDIEIICVDDGSTDYSLNILNNYAKNHDFIKVITQQNRGSGSARNTGILNATARYIAFLDADDIYLDNNALDMMYELAVKTDADMVGANLKRINKDASIDENYNPTDAPFKHYSKEEVLSPREYGIPWAFYKNIYKRSFLEDHDIIFPSLSRGQDPIFLAKALSHLKEMPVLSVDLYGYNHTVSGGVNLKLNTYDKKRDYINHFIDTMDLLEKNNFIEALSLYKKEFINFLNFRQNIYDEDIRNIITELMGLDKHFKETDYGYFIIDYVRNPPVDEDIEYNLIKQCLFEESMLENTYIDVYRLKEYTKISHNRSNNITKSSYRQLKKIEEYTFEDKRRIFGKVGKLEKEIKHYIKSNNTILTSKSWKFTSYLRSLKNKI